MSQPATYNSATKRPSAENQFLLNEFAPRNGSTPRSARKNTDYHEKQPLFDRGATAEPVRLTPAWEETNLPNDELNFKGVTMEQADLEMNPPKDSKEYTGIESNYVTNFLGYLGFAAQVPNLVFNWLNIFVQIGGNLTTRVVWSIFIEAVVFIITIILAMCNSSEWPGFFFWTTMITVNVSGTFTAIISLIASIMAPSIRTAAIYYFITALFVLLACFDTYFALPLNRFYRYHELVHEKEMQRKKKENRGVQPSIPYLTVFLQCLPQCFNVFFTFFVTLSIFPAVQADINKSDPNFFVSDELYVSVTCFLTFNICALIGSILSTLGSWPSPKYLVIPVVMRVLFIPFFLVCNYHPRKLERKFPILVENDWVYWSGAAAMAVSSGYYSSVAMMYCPGSVEPQYASTAGMFGAASLISGIFGGIMFTLLMPKLVTIIEWNI
uniref:Equilibrative nucleoside transporter n=1 Tax=Timema genevievae TaxID=629358 RepID=A0A7R9JPL8_TIMGE|nr:unnamed protein product [Timema genevievae]